jgi:hypothetical protein
MKTHLTITFTLLGLVGLGGLIIFSRCSAPDNVKVINTASNVDVQPATIKTPASPAVSTLSPPDALAQTKPPSPMPEGNLARFLENPHPNALRLTSEQLRNYLRENNWSAESYLAVYQLSGNPDLLREAASRFPDDPRLNLQLALAHIDVVREHDPENALPDYLIALDHLRTGNVAAALDYLIVGTDKPYFDDYPVSVMQAAEEGYLSADFSPREAKIAAMVGVPRNYITRMLELSRQMATLQAHYTQVGDSASADAVTQMGLTLGQRMQNDSLFLIDELGGASIEMQFLAMLDPAASAPRLAEIEARVEAIRAHTRASVKTLNELMQMNSIDAGIFSDRLKLYGEDAAIQWLRTRQGTE